MKHLSYGNNSSISTAEERHIVLTFVFMFKVSWSFPKYKCKFPSASYIEHVAMIKTLFLLRARIILDNTYKWCLYLMNISLTSLEGLSVLSSIGVRGGELTQFSINGDRIIEQTTSCLYSHILLPSKWRLNVNYCFFHGLLWGEIASGGEYSRRTAGWSYRSYRSSIN